MKITKILPILVLVLGLSACGKPAGELVGASVSGPTGDAEPLGMRYIRKGSFLMGANDQSAIFAESDENRKVSVNAFWMDETEITNSEYRQFVHWVRDSIARTLLIENEGDDSKFTLKDNKGEVLTKKMGDDELPRINWSEKIPWENRGDDTEDNPMRDVYDSLFYEGGAGGLRTTKLYYHYSWRNIKEAVSAATRFDVSTASFPKGATVNIDTFWINANGSIESKTITRPLREPKDLITNAIICVYPDTLVWARDFEYSYNEPLLNGYFSMPSYSEYPVVGVTWEQAHAFCHWRTQLLRNEGKQLAQSYRLPTEAEWEYAARGGLRAAMYPWGDRYARDNTGCFLANFKPYRGSYSDDTGTTTMAVGGFDANDFGLYDMAGNVAEWTSSSYSSKSNTYVHDMNPDFPYMARKKDPAILKRKVVKGGSWKDISYYLQCGVRTYEYQNESRSYIGFRCVRSAMTDRSK